MRFPCFPGRFPVLCAALLPALLFAACAEPFDEGVVSMSIDGEAFSPTLVGDVVDKEGINDPWRYVYVEDEEQTFQLAIPLGLSEGAHDLGFESNPGNGWLWVQRGTDQYHSAWGEGELVITRQSDTRLRGTFSGTLRNHDESASIVVTDGTFDLEGSFITP